MKGNGPEVQGGKYISPNIWTRYRSFVETTLRSDIGIAVEDITYWRDRLFIQFVTYMLPVCLLALVPGVFEAIKNGYIFIAVFDLLSAALIAFITLVARLKLVYRKAFVLVILYSLAIVLLLNLGLFGPGVLYLFALSVFVALFFSTYFAYWAIAINLSICIYCAVLIHLKLFNLALANEYNLGAWIAVSSNLVFLSWISVILINGAIRGLESTIIKEFRLKAELQDESLKLSLNRQQIIESEGHYKSLFFLNPSPMWVLEHGSLRFLQVNDAAILQYGYSNDEFMAMNIQDIKLEEDVETLQKDLQRNFNIGAPLSIVTQHRKKSQERIYVDVIFNSIPFKGTMATLAIIRDISEQVNYNKKIEIQNDKLREIAYMQSHYVRAPLARILGLVNLINIDKGAKPDIELLDYLVESANDLDQVIRTITKNAESTYSEQEDNIGGATTGASL